MLLAVPSLPRSRRLPIDHAIGGGGVAENHSVLGDTQVPEAVAGLLVWDRFCQVAKLRPVWMKTVRAKLAPLRVMLRPST